MTDTTTDTNAGAGLSFGAWLRQRRRTLHLTQEELAQQVACSTATLRKLEAEQRRPSAGMAQRLAQALNVPAAEWPKFLRFARGDPFAAPSDSIAPRPIDKPPAVRHNLPLELTSFIGREKEIEDICCLIATARLVTLTGAGGSGKTRLALRVAAGLLDEFADGVWLIELAPLADPALVPQVVATVLGVIEIPGRPSLSLLADHLRPQQTLVVLDNCEHLVRACHSLAETLLRTCPQLKILATSREGLGLAGESAHSVRSLSLPDAKPFGPVAAADQFEAVRLFVERAKAAWPGFTLTNDNAPAVAQVCRQLDGIPLAIELAAARVGVLPVEKIVVRLTARFHLPAAGRRTPLPRHQTLATLIDWSYDLLSAPERALFGRLAVFAGGWTLEAAEAVGAGQGVEAHEMLDLLLQLANKSLVIIERQLAAEARYHMLETIRQYAQARLAANGEADAMHRRHLDYYLALAEASVKSAAVFVRLEPESDNLRAALAWCRSAADGAELGLRLAAAATNLIRSRYWSETRRHLEGALEYADARGVGGTHARASALLRLGQVLALQGDYTAGQARLTQSLRLFQALGDQLASAGMLVQLGWLARERGDSAAARALLEESIAIYRALGVRPGIAHGLLNLGEVAVMQEDSAWATSLLEEALALWREQADASGIGWSLNHLGHVAQLQGRYEQATQLHEESLVEFSRYGEPHGNAAEAFQSLGEIALAQGQAVLAAQHLTKALAISRDIGYPMGVQWCLAGLAGLAVLNENPRRAAQLWGAAESLRQSIGGRHAPASRATRERLMAAAREQLGEAAFAAAWAEGQKLTQEQAVALALDPADPA